MPPELLELMQQAEQLMAYITQNGASLNAETQQSLGGFLQQTMQFIEQFQQNAPEQPPQPSPVPPEPIEATPSHGAQLIWILAGQNPDAFISYLQTYPDPELNALANNRSQLTSTIQFLNRMMPAGEQPVTDGIQHADLNSSNIYGFKYDPKSGKLQVRFQSGSIYGYDGVPPNVFKAFQQGARAATTQGQNAHGRWWVGKIPSLGAAFHQLIRNGGYPYQQLQ